MAKLIAVDSIVLYFIAKGHAALEGVSYDFKISPEDREAVLIHGDYEEVKLHFDRLDFDDSDGNLCFKIIGITADGSFIEFDEKCTSEYYSKVYEQ